MPELTEDKRKQLDDIVGKMHVNNESDENIQTLVNDFKSKNTVQSPPETGIFHSPEGWKTEESKIPFGLGHAFYTPLEGAQQFGQGVKDLFTPGSRLKGAHEAFQGALGATLPVTLPLAIANPITAAGALAGGAVGGAAGKYIPQKLGASEELSDVTGDVGSLIGGGLGAKVPGTRFGGAVSTGLKAAVPDIGKGAAMIGAGELAAKVPGMEWPARIGMGYPGARAVAEGLNKGARAFGEAWKRPKVEPPSPPPIPTKGPSIGDLKTAVSKGTMTPEAFDASIDKMSDLTPEAKNLHKANVRASQTTPVKFPVTSPKTLNLGQLQKSVGSGRMSIEDFTGEVKKLGYTEEHANELTEQLKDSLKEEKEAEEAKKAKSTSEPKEKPKNQTKAPEIKLPPMKKIGEVKSIRDPRGRFAKKVEPPGASQ